MCVQSDRNRHNVSCRLGDFVLSVACALAFTTIVLGIVMAELTRTIAAVLTPLVVHASKILLGVVLLRIMIALYVFAVIAGFATAYGVVEGTTMTIHYMISFLYPI